MCFKTERRFFFFSPLPSRVREGKTPPVFLILDRLITFPFPFAAHSSGRVSGDDALMSFLFHHDECREGTDTLTDSVFLLSSLVTDSCGCVSGNESILYILSHQYSSPVRKKVLLRRCFSLFSFIPRNRLLWACFRERVYYLLFHINILQRYGKRYYSAAILFFYGISVE